MIQQLKIYVASSWRNLYQPGIVELLRVAGYDVYDFRNPIPGDDGFRWSEIDPDWKKWTVEKYAKALEHPIAERGFSFDFKALCESDLCVLLLPSGRSASWEYGYHNAMAARPGIVHMPEACEPELMYRGSTFTDTNEKLLAAIVAHAERYSLPQTT